jgi:4-diphosphocytidyl-2-C-methyl-D-erythritol kinase
MKALLDVPAPAKLNLFLHIIGRRPDGYHLMQSVFVLLDLCDSMDFEWRSHEHISREDCDNHFAPLPENDLVVRAARLLQQATGCTQGAHIRLRKRIPMQAGMGGGSSDAASCLLALNRLWNTGLSRQELMSLGVQLGADVPFFLFGDNAWVEGIGEELSLITMNPQKFLVVKPDAGLATAAIFNDPNLKRDTEPATMRGFAECSDVDKLRFGRNDLQAVAQTHCPDISECVLLLKGLGLSARMTGSGSAVFAPTDSGQLPQVPSTWFAAHTHSLCEHPLKSWPA